MRRVVFLALGLAACGGTSGPDQTTEAQIRECGTRFNTECRRDPSCAEDVESKRIECIRDAGCPNRAEWDACVVSMVVNFDTCVQECGAPGTPACNDPCGAETCGDAPVCMTESGENWPAN